MDKKESASTEEIQVDEVDTVHKVRSLAGWSRQVIAFVGVAMVIFQLYTAFFGTFIANVQRATHIGFVLILTFLIYKPLTKLKQDKIPWYDWIFAILALVSYGYFVIKGQEISTRLSFVQPLSTLDIVMGVIAAIVLLEATRRTIGHALLIIILVFIVYTFFGGNLPGQLAHHGFDLQTVIEQLFYTTSSVFGTPLGVSATFIFLFILFGKFLEATGGGQFFIDLANAAMGKYRGGPAKTAVASSALMGTISGSAVANVVTTGAFTIPMMKKTGYDKTFAGAVEAVSSSGGQIMPPIMGASAFIIASFVGVPYAEIALAALIPAIIYFLCEFFQVDFRAARTNLRGLKKEELPRIGPVFRDGFLYLVPLFVIIFMLASGASTNRAGLFAIIAAVLVGLIKRPKNLVPKNIVLIFDSAARGIIETAVACAAAGIVIGLVSLTGIGLRFTSLILDLSGGNLLITLIFTMITSIILGMGLPTVAAYIVQVSLTIPALIELGVHPIAAHMFVFYFACMSAITPPVALAAFAAAGIAKANPMATGLMAMRLGIAAFIVPFVFVYSPSLLLLETTWGEAVLVALTVILGAYALAAAAEGWLLIHALWFERLLLFAAAIMLIIPNTLVSLTGLGIGILVAILQWLRRGKNKPALTNEAT